MDEQAVSDLVERRGGCRCIGIESCCGRIGSRRRAGARTEAQCVASVHRRLAAGTSLFRERLHPLAQHRSTRETRAVVRSPLRAGADMRGFAFRSADGNLRFIRQRRVVAAGRTAGQGFEVFPAEHAEFADHCALCLRCLHACPQEAIQIGRLTVGKFRWRGPKGDFRPLRMRPEGDRTANRRSGADSQEHNGQSTSARIQGL